MSPLVQNALNDIESDSQEVVSEAFLVLAEVISVNRMQNFTSDVVPEANAEVLEWGPIEQIQKAVKGWIERRPDHPLAGQAFWVLDKFADESLRPFLRKWLQYYVDRILPNMSPLGQILVDLETIGESSVSKNSYAANEYGKNLEDALVYLNLKTAPPPPKEPRIANRRPSS